MTRKDDLEVWIEDQAELMLLTALDDAHALVLGDPGIALSCVVAAIAPEIIRDAIADALNAATGVHYDEIANQEMPIALGLLKATKKRLPQGAVENWDRAEEEILSTDLSGPKRPRPEARLPVDPRNVAQWIMAEAAKVPEHVRFEIYERCEGSRLLGHLADSDWVEEYGRHDDRAPLTVDEIDDQAFRDRINYRIIRRARKIAKDRYR